MIATFRREDVAWWHMDTKSSPAHWKRQDTVKHKFVSWVKSLLVRHQVISWVRSVKYYRTLCVGNRHQRVLLIITGFSQSLAHMEIFVNCYKASKISWCVTLAKHNALLVLVFWQKFFPTICYRSPEALFARGTFIKINLRNQLLFAGIKVSTHLRLRGSLKQISANRVPAHDIFITQGNRCFTDWLISWDPHSIHMHDLEL